MLTSVKECGEAPAPNSMRYDNVSPTERIERGQNYPSHSCPQIGSQAQPWSLAVGPGPAPLGPDFVLRSWDSWGVHVFLVDQSILTFSGGLEAGALSPVRNEGK